MESEIQFLSVAAIAQRWGCSEDKAARVLKKYRGRSGFMDLGSGNARRRKRRYSIVRIHPSLLREIEGALQ